MNNVRRLVFTNIVRSEAFERLAEHLGWRLVGKTQSDVSTEAAWVAPEIGAAVTYVDDRVIGLQYLAVEGTSETILAVAQKVDPFLPFYTHESVKKFLMRGAPEYDPVLALYVAALIAPPWGDPEILDWFRAAMKDPDPRIRRAAYFATTYPGWREFDEMLKERSEHDPDSEARISATKAHSSLVRNVWSKPQV
jgi:hypothetical protein